MTNRMNDAVTSAGQLAKTLSGLSEVQRNVVLSMAKIQDKTKAQALSFLEGAKSGEYLTESTIEGYLATTKFTDAQKQQAIVGALKNSVDTQEIYIKKEQIENLVDEWVNQKLVTEEKRKDTIAELENMAAQKANNLAIEDKISTLKKLAKEFLKANKTLGIAALVVGVIVAVNTIEKKIREAIRKTADESAQAHEQVLSEVNSLNSELDTTKKRLEELDAKGHLSVVEQEEYNRLKDTNDELQRQYDIKLALAEMTGKKAERDALKAVNIQDNRVATGSSSDTQGTRYSDLSDIDAAKYYIEQIDAAIKKTEELRAAQSKEAIGSSAWESYEQQINTLAADIDGYEIKISTLSTEIAERADDINGYTKEGVQFLAEYEDLNEKILATSEKRKKIDEKGSYLDPNAARSNLISRLNTQSDNLVRLGVNEKDLVSYDDAIAKLNEIKDMDVLRVLFSIENVGDMTPQELLNTIQQAYDRAADQNAYQNVDESLRKTAEKRAISANEIKLNASMGSEEYSSFLLILDSLEISLDDYVKSVNDAGASSRKAAEDAKQSADSFSALKTALATITPETQPLDDAILKLGESSDSFNEWISAMDDSGKYANLDSLLTTFPQLKDEILAYNAGLISATDLQRALNQTVTQFKADTLGDQLKAVVDATEEYGDGSFQVIQAIQDMDAVLPGVSKLLLDKETALRAVESGAYKSAEAMIEFVRAEYAASTAAAQADYENLVKQFGNVNNAALRAAAAQWMQAKADQATVERILGLLAKTDREYEPKGSSEKKEKDLLLESYQTEIARLDHLREMDQINEATYYNDKLAALQTYLKDRKKYQEQWWAWEEEFHNYQKQLIEDEIDQLEDQRDKQIDTNKEYYKNLKKQKEKEYDLEKDRVDKVIDALEKEEDAKKKAIQKQRDLLDEQADDRDYNKSIEEKNKEIADIKAQLTVIDLDDSAESKAKKIALQEELTDKLNDLEDYQYDHSIDTQKSALDKQETYWEDHFGKLIEAQELYLENLKTMYDQTIESIESSMEAMTNSIKASFESLIAAKQSLLDNAGSIPGMAEITPIGGGSGDDKSGSNEYKVKEGDNLSRIAKAKGTSVSKLLELNPWIKDKNKIYPGQIIKYHDGGVVGKSINDKDKEVLSQLIPVSRDEVLAKLLRGEVVVNEKQQGLMRDAWMSIAPSMALATKQADMAKALASNVTTNNSPNIVFDMKIEVGNTDAAGLTALQRQLENFKNEAVKAVYERMSNHRQKTGRINPSGRY